jgi:hypothetical protein
VAFALAACALVAGAISVVAFFARGPDVVRPSAAAAPVETAVPVGSPSSAITNVGAGAPEAVPVTSIEIEPETEPADTSAADATAAAPGTKRVAPHVRRPAAFSPPKSSGPHITSQPRY